MFTFQDLQSYQNITLKLVLAQFYTIFEMIANKHNATREKKYVNKKETSQTFSCVNFILNVSVF